MSKANGTPIATIPCGCCRGTGRIPLTGRYAETLALLRKQKREVSGAELARLAGIRGEAMCNRLVPLERHGLATSRRDGVRRMWKAT